MSHNYFRHLAVGTQVALRGSVAAGLSLAIARALGLEEPILALVASVIATDRKAAEGRRLGIRRVRVDGNRWPMRCGPLVRLPSKLLGSRYRYFCGDDHRYGDHSVE